MRFKLNNLEGEEEWIITDGFGGYSYGSFDGINRRKYHGIHIMALDPPVQRYVMLSGLIIRSEGFTINPFPSEDGLIPIWTEFDGNVVRFLYTEGERIISLEVSGEKIAFKVLGKKTGFEVEPLLAMRHIYALNENLSVEEFDVKKEGNKVRIRRKGLSYVLESGNDFIEEPRAVGPVEYVKDKKRGESHQELLFSPGSYIIGPEGGEIRLQGYDIVRPRVARTHVADSFLVRDLKGRSYIIAGYPWFSVWTRDAFVSLPGLAIVRGRFKEARKVISSLLNLEEDGLLPELIDEETREPKYGSVDSTLWLGYALRYYLAYTDDIKFLSGILPVMRRIVERHMQDVDEEGFLLHGPETWMDVKVKGRPLIDRSDMAIEVEALWASFLDLYLKVHKALGLAVPEEVVRTFRNLRTSFVHKFWDEELNYFCDHIKGGQKDRTLRPNQVIALALEGTIIDERLARAALSKVWERLVTPFGLRTLDPEDGRYMGRYEGDVLKRDTAYHNGTVWPWLTGFMVKAYLKYGGSKELAYKLLLKPLLEFLNRGHLNEVFEGDWPHRPSGCHLQAWNVGELIRSYHEDYLGERGRFTLIWS